jgi:hypothetical protein
MRYINLWLANGYCSNTIANHGLIRLINFISWISTHVWKNFVNKFYLIILNYKIIVWQGGLKFSPPKPAWLREHAFLTSYLTCQSRGWINSTSCGWQLNRWSCNLQLHNVQVSWHFMTQLVRHKNAVDKCERGDFSDWPNNVWIRSRYRGMGLPLSLHVLLISDRVPEVDLFGGGSK